VDLRPGLVIRALPRFYGGTLDSSTIEINSGVIVKGDVLWAKGDWRTLTEHETEILGLGLKGAEAKFKNDPSQTPDTLWVYAIPVHLLQHWQRISEPFAPKTGSGSFVEGEQYRGFVSQVVDFFRFKAVPLPNKCKFEMVSNFPQIGRATEVPATEERGSGTADQVSIVVSEEVQVAVNLGDTTSSLIFVNLSIRQMESILGERCGNAGVTGRSNVERFFSCYPDYPCFRISLSPRMGYALGSLATVLVRSPLSHPDLWLCVSSVPD
jgi:hypothetical protein